MTFCLLSVNWKVFGIVWGVFFVIALVFAILILIVSKICKLDEDKKVEAIIERLGGSNCGGCGCSGCAAFAKKLVSGEGDVHACHATTNQNAKEIAEILGIEYKEEEPVVAVVKCSGGLNAKNKYNFVGYTDCSTLSTTFQGGPKVCPTGCIGGGECLSRCVHGAIQIKDNLSVIDRKLCVSCGACVQGCPKSLIELVPRSATVYIACSSHCRGKDVMGVCDKGCIGCGLCAKNCPQGAITMQDNLPIIDYTKCNGCKTCMAKCPRKIIREM